MRAWTVFVMHSVFVMPAQIFDFDSGFGNKFPGCFRSLNRRESFLFHVAFWYLCRLLMSFVTFYIQNGSYWHSLWMLRPLSCLSLLLFNYYYKNKSRKLKTNFFKSRFINGNKLEYPRIPFISILKIHHVNERNKRILKNLWTPLVQSSTID